MGAAQPPWTRRQALAATGALLAGSAAGCARAMPGARRAGGPNLLFVISDDHRADVLSSAGHPVVRTPHLDQFAASATDFRAAFSTTSLCSPSRASMFSGLYGARVGVATNNGVLPAGAPLLFPLLRASGVHTAAFGKWGLTRQGARGGADVASFFDRSLLLGIRSDPWDSDAWEDGRPVRLSGYTDDTLVDRALEHVRDLSRRGVRWFVMLSFRAPHEPLTASPARQGEYADTAIPPLLAHPPATGAPAYVKALSERLRLGPGGAGGPRRGRGDQGGGGGPLERRRAYYRCVATVDDLFGKFLREFDTLPAAGDTTVFYTSDNGHLLGDHGIWEKRAPYEPAIRIPLLVRAADPARRRGHKVDALVLNTDLGRTLLDRCGVDAPSGWGDQGRSLGPWLDGHTVPDWRRDFLYIYDGEAGRPEFPTIRAVRDARWKYVANAGDRSELYDLWNDRDEVRNLVDDPAAAGEKTRLQARMTRLTAELGLAR